MKAVARTLRVARSGLHARIAKARSATEPSRAGVGSAAPSTTVRPAGLIERIEKVLAGDAVISEEEANRLAKQMAKENGWARVDPSIATLRRSWFGRGSKWEILSNALAVGANVRVVLDAELGEILERGYIPR